ncbi:flagellin [Planococcus halocryophilus]|uniref:Flagellin n=1 Tax=Planococcus halocryophilus TaxID=1215089 RepID=A0A1C7DTR6_9BACL|nr:flagellin [Planococcus halocryophilus]ANU14797.1 flagellin [Planococcus halocryophilus]
MIINHNIAALNTHRQMASAQSSQMDSMEKLSSGLRINSAKDDAAGLTISEKMRGQIRGLEQASTNAQDSISLIQTAEGSLSETQDILQRMRELAVQSGNDTNTTTDRGEIQKEIDSLTSEINRIGNTTEFNTQKLLNGSKDSTNLAVAAGQVTVGGMTFDTTGGALNGYTFEMGTVTDGTVPSVVLDADTKKITINGDFDATATGFTAASDIETALNAELITKGVTQTVTVGGASAATATGDASGAVTGGVDAGAGLQFQIGANENQSLTLEITDMRAKNLGLSGATGGNFASTNKVSDGTNGSLTEAALDLSTAAKSAKAITIINNAIEKVSGERSKLGANQNRLEHTINNLNTSSENLTAAESRIRDVDYAEAA